MTDRPPGAIKSLHELEMLAQRNGGEALIYTVGDERELVFQGNGSFYRWRVKLVKRWFVPEWAVSKDNHHLIFLKTASSVGAGYAYVSRGQNEFFYGNYAIFTNYWFAYAHLNRVKLLYDSPV